MRLIPCVFLLVAMGTSGRAQPPSQEDLARSHYRAGEEEYARGRWREALHEFELGYALSPRPEFLINFAQVYRKLGEHERAIAECERFLATAPEDALALQARRLLEQLREEKARKDAEKARAQSPPPAPSPPTLVTPPPVVVTAPPPPPPKRRRWVAPVVVVSVTLVVAAVVVGVVVGIGPRDTYTSTPLGTVDFR
jgi:hypothetical protein